MFDAQTRERGNNKTDRDQIPVSFEEIDVHSSFIKLLIFIQR